jgi:DNA-binding NarL/FixJ family response regulator
MSGGLLYGHEVALPRGLEIRRKNRYVTKPRPAPWRDRVLALVLQGHRRRRIAAELGIKPKHAANHMLTLYRLHGVRSRQALLARFGINFRGTPRGDPPTPDTAGQFLPRQLARVASLLKRGMSDQQIAAEMRLSVPTIMDYRCALYRVYAVHSRRNLIANLRTGAARHRAKLTA